jgi:membrane fusion protein, multidrug efflux system
MTGWNRHISIPVFMGATMTRLIIPLTLILFIAPASSQQAPVFHEGLIEPHKVVSVSSQVPGVLNDVNVERGDQVKKNEVVAQLKSGLERVAVDQASAQLAFAKRRAERNAELFEKEMLSVHERDEMDTEIQLADLQLRQAQERLNMRTIRSPIQGIIVDRYRASGEYAGEEPILKIAQLDPLNVEVIVPFERFGTIQEGMVGEIHPEKPIGGLYQAKVVIVDQVIDAASGTFGVRLELPNPNYRLPAGLRCRVQFPDTQQ